MAHQFETYVMDMLYSMFLSTQNYIFPQVWYSANSKGNGVGNSGHDDGQPSSPGHQ